MENNPTSENRDINKKDEDGDNKKNEKEIKKESKVVLWLFRFLCFFLILGFCFLIIKAEFNELKKEESTRDIAIQMINSLERATSSFKDAWKTIYYFYQTGDLFKIMKCSNLSKTTKDNQKNTLLMLYREKIDKNINNDNETTYLKCRGKITINVGLKNEVYKHPYENNSYTFVLGREPIDMLEKYPFIKHALTRIREGEKATFIAIPAEQKILKPSKQIIYEISVPTLAETSTTNLPLYSVIKRDDEKFIVENDIVCGSVITFLYKIYDINGNILLDNNINLNKKLKVGSGNFNEYIEQLLLQMRAGDKYKIFLPKSMFKPSEFLQEKIFPDNTELIIIEITIVGVSKS